MGLPTHLARYDRLLDMLVEQLVRESSGESMVEKPAAPWQASPQVGDRRANGKPIQEDSAT
jgi:hypothetical protein